MFSLALRSLVRKAHAENAFGEGLGQAVDVRRQLPGGYLALTGQLRCCRFSHGSCFCVGSLTHVLKNAAPLGPGLVTHRRRGTARLGQLIFVVSLGGGELLSGVPVVLGRLGDHVLACLQHLLDRRHHEGSDDRQDDQEDRQDDKEGAVGDEEVVLLPTLFGGFRRDCRDGRSDTVQFTHAD